MTSPLTPYLGWLSVALTYFSLIVGNMAYFSDSERLRIFPALIVVTGLTILALLPQVLTNKSPAGATLRRLGKRTALLVAMEGLLFIWTFVAGFSAGLGVVQFLVAIILLTHLIGIASYQTWKSPVASGSIGKVLRLSRAGLGVLVLLFSLGSFMRLASTGLACPAFPLCQESFFPLPLGWETLLAFTHRWLGVLMAGLFIHLAIAAPKANASLARPARGVMVLGIAQIFLGIGAVMSALQLHSRVSHAATGYLIWGSLSYLAVRSGLFSGKASA